MHEPLNVALTEAEHHTGKAIPCDARQTEKLVFPFSTQRDCPKASGAKNISISNGPIVLTAEKQALVDTFVPRY